MLELECCLQQRCRERGLTAPDSTLREGEGEAQENSPTMAKTVLSFPLPLAPLPSRSPSILSVRRSSPCSLPFSARTDFRLILGLGNASDQDRAAVRSHMEKLQVNADGSYDLYFGPKAPAGKEGM